MKLSGPQFAQVQEALLDAYTEFGLRQMLRMQMDVDLDRVASPGNLEQRTHELISWAESKDQIERLIQAAHEGNQENRALVKLQEDSRSWFMQQDKSPQPLDDVSPTTLQAGHQVFLSYSRKDSQQMHIVYRALTDAGLSVWTDEGLAIGTHGWENAIEQAIKDAECMVVLMSPDAKQSKWVNIEVNFADYIGLDVLPVLIRGQRRESVLLSLWDVQYEDGRDDLSAACDRLIATLVQHDVRSEREPTEQTAQQETKLVDAPAQPGATHEVATERPAKVEPKADEALGTAESVRASRPTIQTPHEPSRNWIGIVAALIALVGSLAVAYATFTGGERGATSLQMTATAGALPATTLLAAAPEQTEQPPTELFGTMREFSGIPFVYVPEGDFWIMQTEVVNSMWQGFMDVDGYKQEAYWSDEGRQWREENEILEPLYWTDSDFNRPQQPVAGVSFYEAEAFANWFSEEANRPMRLPTNAEWELACAGPEGRTYPWGEESPSENLLNFNENVGSTTDVGSYPDGASPYRALDMAGNVWEWAEPGTVRGGSWDLDYTNADCASRGVSSPYDRSGFFSGVRLLSPADGGA